MMKQRGTKLWGVMVAAVILWTIGTGFHADVAADNETTYKKLKTLTDVMDFIDKEYVDKVDNSKLIDKAIQGMVQSLDPHSAFLPPEAFEELQVDTEGEFGGIGIEITMQKGVLTVISPIEGTPAYEAGIQAGDHIVKVNGESTQGMMLWEAVKKMRGEKGTHVHLTIVREGEKEPLEFNLIRAIIPIDSVHHALLKPGYGYVWITSFRQKTSQELEEALEALQSSGKAPLKGLVLDLRYNPGGLLDQAVKVADLFLHKGIIVSIKGRTHTVKEFKAHSSKTEPDFPMVVLINGGSASASEIVAGALQDQKRALLLGTTSFGKGSVQTVERLPDGYGLKLTIARYYTPSGRCIQAEGIKPDIVVRQKVLNPKEAAAAAQRMTIKEKDLKNHLAPAESLTPEEEAKPAHKTPKKPKETTPKATHEKPAKKFGPLRLDSPQDDQQVMRALQILVSYNIFKGN
jgi:carboxyl-terminal processing protease